MRILFAGTPGFAARALSALVRAGHDVALVLTQPDRPAGRGMRPLASDVKREAQALGLAVFQPVSLKDVETQAVLRATGARLMVVAAYGLILPSAVLDMFPGGCINIHASLLPRWRGAAPIQRAILAGDSETGVCIMQMDAGLDTGPVLLSSRIAIEPRETGGSLHDRMAELGADLIVQALREIDAGTIGSQPQPAEGATYARKLTKEDAWIDWHSHADVIDAQVRALHPAPVAHTSWAGNGLRIWQAEPIDHNSRLLAPGQVVATSATGIDVACGDGVLRILQLQRAGGRPQSAAEFLRGHPMQIGTLLGT